MTSVFADTFYFLALLNRKDAAHQRAVEVSRRPGLMLVTTEFVLLELADALCAPHQRVEVLSIFAVVKSDPACRVVPATDDLLARGLKLWQERSDKHWPLTDCISFVVMTEQNLKAALTGDRHFEQAGFHALLV